MRIKVITDSSCDLPIDLINGHDIGVVPLRTIMDGKDEKLTSEEVIRYIDEGREVKSSQVVPSDFEDAYSRALKEYDGVVSVHLSSKLSGTCNNAVVTAKSFGGRVEVIDSLSTSAALGALVVRAAELVSAGKDLKETSDELRRLSQKVETIFGIRVVNNLVKGGRVGPIVGKLTALFNAKPVLRGIDGEIKLYKITLGFKRVLNEIVRFVNSNEPIDGKIFIAHIGAEEDVQYIKERVKAGVFSCKAGPIIAVHGGQGLILVGFVAG